MNTFMSKKEKKEVKIKKGIIKIAKQLFSSKGYKNTTVDEITDKSLIAKATLYQYFESKENLFIETLIDSENTILRILSEKVLNNKELDKKNKLKALFYYLLSYIEKDSYIIHLIFYRENYFEQKVIDFIKTFQKNLISSIKKILLIFEINEKDAEQLAISIMGATYVHMITWYVNGQKDDLKSVSKVLFGHFYITLIDKVNKKNRSII